MERVEGGIFGTTWNIPWSITENILIPVEVHVSAGLLQTPGHGGGATQPLSNPRGVSGFPGQRVLKAREEIKRSQAF